MKKMKALFLYLLLITNHMASHVNSTAYVTGALINAFTNKIGQGNPAGVILSTEPLSRELMITLAREVNHSETAFLTKIGPKSPNTFKIRWFTPDPEGKEIMMCGHGALAAVHFLKSKKLIDEHKPIKFVNEKEEDVLSANIRDEWIELELPTQTLENFETLDGVDTPGAEEKKLFIFKSLGLDPSTIQFIGKAQFDCLIRLSSAEDVLKLKPIMGDLGQVKGNEKWEEFEGFIVTAPYGENEKKSEKDHDFVCRYFGPGIGINEDPVTGSAFCIMVPHYCDLMKKDDFVGFQVSKSLKREGVVPCSYDPKKNKILLRGNAVTVWDLHFSLETLNLFSSKL